MRVLIGLAIVVASLAPASAEDARYFDNPKLLECLVGRAAALVWAGADADDAFGEVRDKCLEETEIKARQSGVDYTGPQWTLHSAGVMIDALAKAAAEEL